MAQFREAERAHIERNRWFLSERLGRPVDWHEAEWDFIWQHRKAWLDELRAKGEYPYER